MITVFLRGGLGNQMFQYALGLNLAKKNKTGLALDTTFLNDRFPRRQFTYRTYDLDVFDIDPYFTALSKISRAVPIPGVWLGLDFAFAAMKDAVRLQRVVREKKAREFDPAILHSHGNTLLWGFWQSEKYFKDIQDDVRAAFRFRHPLLGEAKALAEKIRSCESVALHVRRGDYLLPKYAKTYGPTDISYYDRALAHVVERIPQPTIFVFSDDIAWCRENIHPNFPTVYMDDASRGVKAGGHLELMSLCRHTIIANSSFSWWGAWLNRNPDKIVVASARAHRTARETEDIIPEKWTML